MYTVSSDVLDLHVHNSGHVAEGAEHYESGIPVSARVKYGDH